MIRFSDISLSKNKYSYNPGSIKIHFANYLDNNKFILEITIHYPYNKFRIFHFSEAIAPDKSVHSCTKYNMYNFSDLTM